MNFLEYYKPKNLWRLTNNELNPNLDEHSMIYISAAKNFANLCRSMNCNDIEVFTDVYTGLSNAALALYQAYGFGNINTKELILYSYTFGTKHLDINTYQNIITNIVKLGDKKVLASFLGCLADMSEHLGLERIKNIVNNTSSLEQHLNTLKHAKTTQHL